MASKFQHPFRNKFSAKHRIRKNFLKHDIKVTHIKSMINITHWTLAPKINNKAKRFILTILIQHYTEGQCNKAKNKRHKIEKEEIKVFICIWYDCLCRKFKLVRKILVLTSKLYKVTGHWIQGQYTKIVAFLYSISEQLESKI